MQPAWFLSAVIGRPRSRRQHPRIINDRAGESYQDRRPGPDHRGLPNMVMGRNSGLTRAVDNRTPEQNELIESERRNRRLEMEVDVSEQAAPVFARKQA
ncbi:hypothetical protein MCC00055_19510 [Bifidobacterium longum subsp. longum]|nr:hypothetical protein MCC00055_19510 [Bifidobacterium longum subsp. longum]